MEVVINACFGGFHPSAKAIMLYAQRKGFELHAVTEVTHARYASGTPATYREYDPFEEGENYFWSSFCTQPLNPDGTMVKDTFWWMDRDSKEFRTDPVFVQIVKELGVEANTDVSELKVVEIPDGIDWLIDEYDGLERIEEAHQSWS